MSKSPPITEKEVKYEDFWREVKALVKDYEYDDLDAARAKEIMRRLQAINSARLFSRFLSYVFYCGKYD